MGEKRTAVGKSLDVAGAHRHLFYKCAPADLRTSTNASVGLRDGSPKTHKSSSFTQTDTRETEVQTESFWNSTVNLKLLCFRGSHRKLHHALLLAQYTQLGTSGPICEETNGSLYRSIGCGPSSNEFRKRTDPSEAWVSSFQDIQTINEKLTTRIDRQRNRISQEQEKKLSNLKRTNKAADLLSRFT